MTSFLAVLFAPTIVALIIALTVQAVAEVFGADRSNL